jgi:D-alanyl-D-alanine carboxypeptidase
MPLSRLFSSPSRRVGLMLVGLISASSLGTGAALAAKKAAAPYAPPYSELVVDARTGKTLYAVNPDAPRHPASITKVMTLYLLFEELESGRLTLGSQIKISPWAAKQAPSKLGLSPGDTISVEDAIKAVVTKSANDIAVAIAEQIGGSEANFADLMTRKAHALGMAHTNYANASGLPNPRQITTARDLVTLGKTLQQRFPKYFAYFSLRSFDYDGSTIANHNKLLGRVDGVDGIKTGYTQTSGFNLLTSVHSDDKALLAVILGGRSGPSRDRRMAELIDTYIDNAVPASGASSGKKRVAQMDTASNEIAQGDADIGGQGLKAPSAAKTQASNSITKSDAVSTAASASRNWWIQVGVTKDEKSAKALLAEISQKDSLAPGAVAATEKIKVAGRDMWRSRFVKMTEPDAAAACARIKKRGQACFASRS